MAEPGIASVRPYAPTKLHYEHPLICWSSVLAGVAIAIVIGFALTILGVAIGATAINPFQSAREQAPGWTIGGGLWVAFSNLVAIQIGAFVAARAAKYPDHHHGALQGLLVWAVAFIVALVALGVGAGSALASNGDASALGALQTVADAAQTATGEAARESVRAQGELSVAQADAVQDATAVTAWWAFATMVLGGIGAVAGGKLGSDHPDWTERDRRVRPVTMADKV